MTYHHDYAAFDRLVLCAPFMLEEMLARGAKVLERAEHTAPFDPDDPDGEHYRDAFVLSGGIREVPTRRAYARIENTDKAAWLVEYGAWNVPRYATLRNALDAASGSVHGRTYRALTKGTRFEPAPPKPRKPKGTPNG